MTNQEQRHEAFKKDLKELLIKHKAELVVEEFDARAYSPGTFEMVVEFDFDNSQPEGDMFIADLRLGGCIDKN